MRSTLLQHVKVLLPGLCSAEGWPCSGSGWSAWSDRGSLSCWCSQTPPELWAAEMGCTGRQTCRSNTNTEVPHAALEAVKKSMRMMKERGTSEPARSTGPATCWWGCPSYRPTAKWDRQERVQTVVHTHTSDTSTSTWKVLGAYVFTPFAVKLQASP